MVTHQGFFLLHGRRGRRPRFELGTARGCTGRAQLGEAVEMPRRPRRPDRSAGAVQALILQREPAVCGEVLAHSAERTGLQGLRLPALATLAAASGPLPPTTARRGAIAFVCMKRLSDSVVWSARAPRRG